MVIKILIKFKVNMRNMLYLSGFKILDMLILALSVTISKQQLQKSIKYIDSSVKIPLHKR